MCIVGLFLSVFREKVRLEYCQLGFCRLPLHMLAVTTLQSEMPVAAKLELTIKLNCGRLSTWVPNSSHGGRDGFPLLCNSFMLNHLSLHHTTCNMVHQTYETFFLTLSFFILVSYCQSCTWKHSIQSRLIDAYHIDTSNPLTAFR